MKTKNFWFGILVMVLVFGMAIVGCGNDDSTNDSSQVKYEGKDVTGNTYILTIIKKTERAAYIPAKGDSFLLIIKITEQPDKKSSGIIEDISDDGTFTLQPSVEGSGTFSVVISSQKISSVTGDIAIEGGDVITPRSFGNIYLRANRWDHRPGTDMYGENWSSGMSIKLSDFYPTTDIKSGSKIKISGTVDKELGNFSIELQRVLINSPWSWIGSNRDPYTKIIAGSFDNTIDIFIDDPDVLTNEELGEVIVHLANQLNNIYDNQYIFNYGNIPDDIPNGTIMATISNFKISLVDEDDSNNNN